MQKDFSSLRFKYSTLQLKAPDINSDMSVELRMAEVERHLGGEGGVWTVIHNKVVLVGNKFISSYQVYDVSTFLQEHPGGAAILEENSGVYFPCKLDLVEILYITYHILSMENLLCEN